MVIFGLCSHGEDTKCQLFSQRRHKNCVLLKQNMQNEQKIFLILNVLWKVSILLITKLFQTTEAWENLTKDSKTL